MPRKYLRITRRRPRDTLRLEEAEIIRVQRFPVSRCLFCIYEKNAAGPEGEVTPKS